MRLQRQMADVYEGFGYLPLETPALENLSVLLGSGGGDENEKLIFKVMKRGAKLEEQLKQGATQQLSEDSLADFGMRFDMTVPLSRCVAEYRSKIKFPWKVFHIGPVWRAERSQKGRYREFLQCDVDIIGAQDISAECDVIAAGLSAVASVTSESFSLHMNDRRLLRYLAQVVGWPESQSDLFAILLDKRDKLSLEKLKEEFKETLGSVPGLLEKILSEGFSLDDLEAQLTKSIASEESVLRSIFSQLRAMIGHLQALGLSQFSFRFDPSLARGLGYYSGPVFELRHESAGYSLGGGGRYDQLIGRFTREAIPAVGFSIGLERLALLLGGAEAPRSERRVLVAVLDEDDRAELSRLAMQWRQKIGNLSALSGAARLTAISVYPSAAKLKKQFSFASEEGFSHILLRGGDERSRGILKLKALATGLESEVSLATLNEKGLEGLLA